MPNCSQRPDTSMLVLAGATWELRSDLIWGIADDFGRSFPEVPQQAALYDLAVPLFHQQLVQCDLHARCLWLHWVLWAALFSLRAIRH